MKKSLSSALSGVLHTTLGSWIATLGLRAAQYRVFSPRTVQMMEFDLLRLRARIRHSPNAPKRLASVDRLHFGCGGRRVAGWLNADVAGSEYDVDLASGCLPWSDAQFTAIVGQHVIEHLELQSELLPLLAEFRRVCKPGAEIWLTCPDLERVCASYAGDKGSSLIDDRLSRPNTGLGMDGVPSQHMINNVFQQGGEHRNLLDFELLSWALRRSGFMNCERVEERDLLTRFPEFPRRNDDAYTLYVRAHAGNRGLVIS